MLKILSTLFGKKIKGPSLSDSKVEFVENTLAEHVERYAAAFLKETSLKPSECVIRRYPSNELGCVDYEIIAKEPMPEKEHIATAAIMIGQDMIITMPRPFRHDDIMFDFSKIGVKFSGTCGFLTSKGRFVGRVEAREIAMASRQCNETEYPQLYSEDLW